MPSCSTGSLSRPISVRAGDDPAFDPSRSEAPEATFDDVGVAGSLHDAELPSDQRAREQEVVVSTANSPFSAQVDASRSRPFVRNDIDPSSRATLSPPPFTSRRSTPTRSRTHLVPLTSSDEDPQDRPLASSTFSEGLRWAGYLEPLDTSRNKIKQRFNHFLEKENFKASLYAFLEHAGVERLGEHMVRFVGAEGQEPHSPYASIFVTEPIAATEPVKIYVGSASTQWTYVGTRDAQDSQWICKAKRFWPVRVVFQGPNPTDGNTLAKAAAASTATTSGRPRPKRRDTFQRAVDLDAEIRKRDEAEARDEKAQVKANTERNSARPADSPSIRIDTKNTAPVVSSSRTTTTTTGPDGRRPNEAPSTAGDASDLATTPVTPTILESVRQLGQSVVASMPPGMQQLPTVMQHRLGELRHWFGQPNTDATGREYDDAEDDDEDDLDVRLRRERRGRKRRERRAAREERELDGFARHDEDEDEDDDRFEVERKARKEERRRRRNEYRAS
ncbi:hypothetical protein JCM10212_003638 [Sporobolomyces blumeae]